VTKSGQAFSRVWVASWLAGGFVATSAVRIALRIALRAVRLQERYVRHHVELGRHAEAQRVAQAVLGLHVSVGVDQAGQQGATAAVSPRAVTTSPILLARTASDNYRGHRS
jgi:hypothetical protein